MTVHTRLSEAVAPSRVLEVTLTDPGRANALGPETVAGLTAALAQAEADEADLVVLRAEGDTFCGGIDLREADEGTDATWLHHFCSLHLLLERIAASSATTLACVTGPAIGAGADLVLATDLRWATSRARLSFPGSRFGAVLGTGRLAALAGPAFAQEATLTRRSVSADEAERVGLWTVVADDDLDRRVEQTARAAAQTGSPTRRALREAARTDPDRGALDALVRSLISEPGLADRIRLHRDAVRAARAAPSSEASDPSSTHHGRTRHDHHSHA